MHENRTIIVTGGAKDIGAACDEMKSGFVLYRRGTLPGEAVATDG